MKPGLLELLAERPVIFDGAMGTELYNRNHFINVCFEELSESRPEAVKQIHAENREAGADVLTTNSFGANRFKLADFLLGDRVGSIAKAAAENAREIAGGKLLVAGSIGPLGRVVGRDISEEEALEAFTETIIALQEGEVDFIIFETFSRSSELALAVRAAAMLEAPYIPSLSFGDRNISRSGESIDDFFARVIPENHPPLMLGFNCAVGPRQMLENLEDFLPRAPHPVLVMPNAGYPQHVHDRMMYMSTPEYFASYARRFIELGARGIGGCCGTTPKHIEEAAKSIKNLHRQKIEIPEVKEGPLPVEPAPLSERSEFAAKLARGEWVTSVEITPPLGYDLAGILSKASRCKEAGVDCINIPDGPRASSRVSPVITAEKIQNEAGIEAVLHVTCRDRNIIGMQSDLLGCAAAGLNNLLIVTGDPPKLGDYPHATAVFDVDSIGLVRIASRLNHGLDIGGKQVKPATKFLIGVGADPTHLDQDREVSRFRMKAEAGADFCITQPVYDADALIRFLERIEGSRLRVIAGVWPLASLQNARFLKNEVPGVTIPDEVMARMEKAPDKEAAREEGILIAREIVEKIRPHVQGIQVSAPFGNVDTAIKVIVGK